MIPELTTERLTLRGPKPADAAPLGAFLAGARSVWIGGPWTASEAPDWLDDQVNVWQRRGWGSWVVAHREDDCAIGRVGLLEHDGFDEPELGWMLFDGFEGRGLAFEAVVTARRFAQGDLGLPALCSFLEDGNLRSHRLAERLGAQPERRITLDGLDLALWRHPAGGAA